MIADSFMREGLPTEDGEVVLEYEAPKRYNWHDYEYVENGQIRKVPPTVHDPKLVGYISRVGIARPGFCTCPVRTLMIFGSKI